MFDILLSTYICAASNTQYIACKHAPSFGEISTLKLFYSVLFSATPLAISLKRYCREHRVGVKISYFLKKAVSRALLSHIFHLYSHPEITVRVRP